MEAEQVKEIVVAAFPEAQVEVGRDGSHYSIRVVSETFAGMTPVKKQQSVYACLNEHIASGALHALHIQALTPAQWAAKQG
ncbi:MAG: BolA/IbaG family iron-sulfur metabolism protein [Pseudomonadales bacterium]|jgi:acid stress-induced BolA-like protein IbaG/YrbA